MAAIQIKTAAKVVPQCYAYTTPGVPVHDGWTKNRLYRAGCGNAYQRADPHGECRAQDLVGNACRLHDRAVRDIYG